MKPRLVAAALACGLTACEAPPTAPPEGRTWTLDAPADFQPSDALEDLLAPPPPIREDQQAIVEQIASDPERFLAQRPPTEVLNEAELVFVGAGRYHDLVTWMGDAVDAGVHQLRPRYAWGLQRGGLHEAALREARAAVEAAPTDAEAWFVLGFVLGQSEVAADGLLEEVRDAFARAISLDPAFVGPSGVTASDLADQIAQIDRALNPPALPTGAPPTGASPHGASPHGGLPPAHPPVPEAAAPDDADHADHAH